MSSNSATPVAAQILRAQVDNDDNDDDFEDLFNRPLKKRASEPREKQDPPTATKQNPVPNYGADLQNNGQGGKGPTRGSNVHMKKPAYEPTEEDMARLGEMYEFEHPCKKGTCDPRTCRSTMAKGFPAQAICAQMFMNGFCSYKCLEQLHGRKCNAQLHVVLTPQGLRGVQNPEIPLPGTGATVQDIQDWVRQKNRIKAENKAQQEDIQADRKMG